MQEDAVCFGPSLRVERHPIQNMTVDQCSALCLDFSGCKGFTVNHRPGNKNGDACDLKEKCHFTEQANATSGLLRNPHGKCMDRYNLTCYGQDIRDGGVVGSEQECCDLCTYTLYCSVWTWSRGTDGHCWLKTGCSRGTPDDRVVSGSIAEGPPIPDHGKNA